MNRLKILGVAVLIIGAVLLLKPSSDKQEIKGLFDKIEHYVKLRDFKPAYALMSPQYTSDHSILDFQYSVNNMVPLQKDWTVVKENGEAYLCVNTPGNRTSPKSTPTYVFRKVKGKWYWTGEMDYWME